MVQVKSAGCTTINYGSIDVGERILGGGNYLQKLMDVEAALARVQAELGVIPQEAADEITRKAHVELLDIAEYERQMAVTGHPLVCLIRVYKDICEGELGEFVHYGTTTQDITDTALVLQMKEVWGVIDRKAQQVLNLLRERAIQYRSLVCMGRTNDQQAVPITLGFRIAGWYDELARDLERMRDAEKRIFVGQFGGAVGTLASLGEIGVRVRDGLMQELGLETPAIAWYASRDRLTEYVTVLTMIIMTLARIGNEVYINSKTEVGELTEGFKAGKVGSSTMPHKRNPFIAGRLSSYGKIARSCIVSTLSCMDATNERDCRELFVEAYPIEDISKLADAALDTAIELLSGLQVHEDAISRNLHCTGGLVFAEALMIRLADEFGRLEAHEMIYQLAQKAISEGLNFRTLLLKDEVIGKRVTAEELDRIMNPQGYIGLSEYFVDVAVGK